MPSMESVRKETYWLWQVKSKSSWWGTWRTSRGGRGSTVLRSNLPGKAPWTSPPPMNFTRDRRTCRRRRSPAPFWTLHAPQTFSWLRGECITQIIQTSGAETDLMAPGHFDIFFFKLAFRCERSGAVCCRVFSVPTVRKTKEKKFNTQT